MRKVKRMIPLVACCCLLMSCSVGQSRQDKLLQYMENKYSEDNFAWVQNELNNNREKYGIIVSSENFPDARILVREYDNESNDYILDNYMAYYFANPAAEYIRMIAADIWGDCKVYCEPHAQDISTSHLTKSSTALDYLQTQSMCNIKVVLPSTELTQEDAEAFRNAIYSQEIYRVNFGVMSLSDVVYYQELTSYVSIPSDKIEDSFYFFLLEDKSEEENMIEWSEGHE